MPKRGKCPRNGHDTATGNVKQIVDGATHYTRTPHIRTPSKQPVNNYFEISTAKEQSQERTPLRTFTAPRENTAPPRTAETGETSDSRQSCGPVSAQGKRTAHGSSTPNTLSHPGVTLTRPQRQRDAASSLLSLASRFSRHSGRRQRGPSRPTPHLLDPWGRPRPRTRPLVDRWCGREHIYTSAVCCRKLYFYSFVFMLYSFSYSWNKETSLLNIHYES